MWEEYREKRLNGFLKAKSGGGIDPDILEILETINSMQEYVTLSSCSGRIAVLDISEVGDKKSARFLGKWHAEVEPEDVINAAMKSKSWGWLIQYPPILHVACKALDDAERLMNAANEAGFRRSGVISLKNRVVEISSLERIELPVSFSGELVVPRDYLVSVVDFANKKLIRGKKKLEKFHILIKAF